jgi:O-antigen/teichoic acid export membrane protein
MTYLVMPINMTLSLTTTIYLINYLEQSEYGGYRLVGSMGLLISYLTSFGIENVMHRFVLDFIGHNYYRKAMRVFKAGLLIRSISIIIVLVMLFSLKNIIFDLFKIDESLQKIFELVILYVSIAPIEGYFANILNMYLENYLNKIILTIKNFLKFILIFQVIRYDLGFQSVIMVMLLLSIVSFVITIYISLKKIKIWELSKSGESKKLPINEMVKYGAYSYFGMNAGIFKQLTMDNFFIAAFLGPVGVASYAFASQLVSYPRMLNPLNIMRSTYSTYLLNSASHYPDKNQLLSKYFLFAIKIYLFSIIPLFIGIGLLAEPITIYVFNPQYVDSLNIFYVLLLSYMIGDMVYCFTGVVFVTKRIDIEFYSNIFSIYNIMMNVILLKFFGLQGVAFATGSTVVLIYFYYVYAFRNIISIDVKTIIKYCMKISVNLLPTTGLLYYTRNSLQDKTTIIVVMLLSVMLYIVASYINKVFTEKERNLINRIIGKKIWVF